MLLNRRDVYQDTDTGAWSRHWLTLCRWYAGSSEPVGSIDMPIVCHEEDGDYLRRLRTLVPRAEKLVGLGRGYDLSS